jgi:hypothetical protein
MRMLGRSLKCNSNKFLKSHFKDAAYDTCVDFFNSVLRNDAVAAAMATRSRGGKSFRASKSICNIRRWLDLWEFHQDLNLISLDPRMGLYHLHCEIMQHTSKGFLQLGETLITSSSTTSHILKASKFQAHMICVNSIYLEYLSYSIFYITEVPSILHIQVISVSVDYHVEWEDSTQSV